MTRHCRQVRGAGAWVACALAAALLAVGGEAAARTLLLAEPQAEPVIDALGPGYTLWLERRLQAAGLSVRRAPGEAASPEALDALAAQSGAEYVLRSSLGLRDGVAEVGLRLYAPGNPVPEASASRQTTLANLGRACEQSVAPVLARLGIQGEVAPPTLDELGTSSRALSWLDRGELLRAWQEVEGRLAPTSTAVREHILELAQRSDAPPAEAARVLAAVGDLVGAWTRISSQVSAQREGGSVDPRVSLAAAEVQLARNNPRQARSYLEGLDPEDAQVQIALGRALAMQRDLPGAHDTLLRAAELEPDNPRPLELLEELTSPPPDELARLLTRAGAREARRLNPRRAERVLKRAAQLDTTAAADAWRERARLEEQLGRQAQALDAWRRAAAAGADDAELWAGIGGAQRALGDAGAQESFDKALALDPNNAEALTQLGLMQVESGRAESSLPLLRRAVESAPARGDSRRALARALKATGRPAEALEVLTGAGAPPPRGASELREVAALERETGDLAGARARLERAVALEPWNPGPRADLAAVYEADGDSARASAARELAAALEGSAEDAEARQPSHATGLDFDALVLSFSSQMADSRRRRVAYLGLREPAVEPREPAGWQMLALRWLYPRGPDFERLDGALDRSLSLRFDLGHPELPESPIVLEQIDRLYAFDQPTSLDAEAIANVNSALGTDAVFLARLLRRPEPRAETDPLAAACADPKRYEIELRMLSGQHPDMASILMDVDCLPGGDSRFGTWNRGALPFFACLSLALLFPLLRGWGRVLVEIKLPPRTKGFLRIKVGRKPEKPKSEERRRRKGDGRLRRSLASFSRYQKHMAGRETLFRWIPARRTSYFVTVHGRLYDAMGDQVIGHFLEEQRVRVERGRTAKLSYDFNPSECAVQVSVLWNGEPMRSARVAVRDEPGSLRYARDGSVFYYLGLGTHTICAGAGDRATECNVEIQSLESAIPVSIELANDDGVMLRGCAEAVEPYLIGDFEAAANLLQLSGQEQLAHLMRGAHFQQRGELERAASEFEAAGCIEEAAELRGRGSDHDGSAALFERAGDFARAADAYRAAGHLAEAGRCYVAAYDYDNAIECFEATGELERVIDLHEKQGAYLDAAALAQEHGNLERALHNLKAIERRDPNFGEACRRIAEILSERGEFDLAAQQMAQAIEASGREAAPVAMHERYAQLLEQGGDKARAVEAYETLRRLDPGRSDLVAHIAQLREELSGAGAGDATRRVDATESRYEILGELGRGGMGVVYKARDKRLKRIVAMKQLPDNLRQNQTAARLFLREARAAAALNHPNIVTVYDADEENGVFHITMELLEGFTLAQIQERRGCITPRDAARLGIQICAGLQYAHDRRVVHRDIKTGNLFFTLDKVVKIMDFGLAKTIEEVRRNSTVIGGTPYYMAPEQAVGGAVDARTDLYAFGVTLYRLLTGAFPFSEGNLGYHHRHTPPPDPRELQPAIPEGMAQLVLELLAKDPAARPPDAAAVGERLREI